jgi:hypothetical protein
MRSVITSGPSATMFRVSNQTLSAMPRNIPMVSRIASRPVTGSSGMLWYTASSVKNAAALAASPSATSSQNRVTISIGVAIRPLLAVR